MPRDAGIRVPFLRTRTMLKNHQANERDLGGVVAETVFSANGRPGVEALAEELAGEPCLHVRTIERTAIIRFKGAEILFAESAVQAASEQLHRLIGEGQTRLLVNLAGVEYLSCAMLGVLATLQKKIGPVHGRIQLCGLNPLLRDIVRIVGLDRVFDIYVDEAEALGLMIPTKAF
jgi:anti-sigma B factor antagonist